MPVKHLISSQDIDKAGYEEILRRVKKFTTSGIPDDLCTGKVVATLFFYPSTRTMTGFQAGMLRAGGGWVGVTDPNSISLGRGESWEDNIITYCSFADCIALRHEDDDAAERAAKVATVPIINGGCGIKEHAVGAIMMLGVIDSYLKKSFMNGGVKVGIYGTPGAKGRGGSRRCLNAFIPVLGHFGAELVVDDLDGEFPIAEDMVETSKKNGLKSLTYDKFGNFAGDIDVLIVTRAANLEEDKMKVIKEKYKPTNLEDMAKMREDAMLYVMLPRCDEVDKEVDADPRSIHMKYAPYQEVCLAVMTYLLDISVE